MFIEVEPVRPSVLDVLVCCVDMVLNTEWVQIEAIDLFSDGSGWGFGITGGRSTGVVVKTVVPGSVAHKDGRLQIGDHIIQIGEINLRGMGSEQVAMVLRQSGSQVHLIVARPVEPSSPEDAMMHSSAPIIPTRLLSEPDELEQQLNIFQQGTNGFADHFLQEYVAEPSYVQPIANTPDLIMRKESIIYRGRPEKVEMENFEVNLEKDYKGLGIIVAGYVCEREDISGIFIKSIAKGSVADLCGQIRVHDQVVEVDGHPLKGYSNCEAVEILRNTGKHVKLQLARYHHGAKFEHLQEAMDRSHVRTEHNELTSPQNVKNASLSVNVMKSSSSMNTLCMSSLRSKWKDILGPKHEIIVAELRKEEDEVGFGFNVESTEEDNCVTIRHFISDICKGHSLDRNGTLFIGDELLEVNGKQLQGQKYADVLSVFKSLPLEIVLTCARSYYGNSTLSLIPWAERLLKAKSDSFLVSNKYSDDQWFKSSGRSLEHLSNIATWSCEPYFIDLVKDDKGLGFRIVEYKDPLLPCPLKENVIVVWSLVPGAAAQVDGRLVPGDRLLSVNNINFRHTNLCMAMQILKYVPMGPVRLGVAKPTALSKSVPAEISNTEQFVQQPSVNVNSSNADIDFVHNGVCHPLPETCCNYATGSQTPSSLLSFGYDSRCSTPFSSPGFSPSGRTWGFDVAILPAALERVIKIRKGTNKLGLVLDLVDRGQNGMVVKSIRPASAVEKEGNIQLGDYILAVNSENMRNITRSQARAIIRRAELISSDIVIKYIPASDAAVHQQSAVLAKMHQSGASPTPSLISRAPSPRVFPAYYKSPYFSHRSTKTTPDGDETDGQISPFSFLSEDEAVPTPSSLGYTDQFDSSSDDLLLDQISEPFPNMEDIEGNDVSASIFPSIEERISHFQTSKQVPLKFTKMSTSPTVSPVQDESPPLLKSPDLPSPPSFLTESQTIPADSENGSISKPTNSLSPRLSVSGCQWGPQRTVELTRVAGQEIGIGVVMGCIDAHQNEHYETLSGIFIKNVVADSPAGCSQMLYPGDRIVEVNEIDLRSASYAEAIDAIQKSGISVKFVVQSLVPWFDVNPSVNSAQNDLDSVDLGQLNVPSSSQEKLRQRSVSEDEDGPLDEDYQGRVYTAKGIEIDRSSAGYVKLSPDELIDQPDEDEFGYTPRKVQKKYGSSKGTVIFVEVERGPYGLGLSLAGNKNRSKMSTFVCGLHPKGNAAKGGAIRIGDELLEVNGKVLYGRCHLNVSATIRGICTPSCKIIILRRDNSIDDMAVRPITHFPFDMEDNIVDSLVASYPGVRTITTKKGDHGLGIMILEGKHIDMGQGIFISDIQKGSPAEQSGLSVGDMILAVNKTNLIGADYELAATVLKNIDGPLVFLVINSSRAVQTTLPNNILHEKSLKDTIHEAKLDIHLAEPKVKSRSPSPLPPPSPLNPTSVSPSLPLCPIPPPAEFSDSVPLVDTLGSEMRVEVHRGQNGLGLSIIGGADTPLHSIIVHEIFENGAVAKDGRLKPGDQILEVNGRSVREANHQEAVDYLLQNVPVVTLLIYRCSKEKETPRMTTFDVELHKKAGKGLGLCIVGWSNSPGVYISEVVYGGAADLDGRLMAGDQILRVNDIDLSDSNQEHAAAVIKTLAGKVSMMVGRLSHKNLENKFSTTMKSH